MFSKVCPCALFIVIANVDLMGNCVLINEKGMFLSVMISFIPDGSHEIDINI